MSIAGPNSDQFTARERRRYLWGDHAILRHRWHNFDEIAPGVFRSNQPTYERLKIYADQGIRTILSLRGEPKALHHRVEIAACEALGIELRHTTLNARKPATRDNLAALFHHFDTLPRPFLMHCKSGADRAGLASALYLLDQEGASLDAARAMLSFRYLHLRRTATGVLDHMLDLYAERLKDGPIPVRQWIATEYNPDALAQSWADR